MKFVIAATGASGTIYLQRLLEQIVCAANEVHLIMSGHARQVAAEEVDELRIPPGVSKDRENDLNVPYVSGSGETAFRPQSVTEVVDTVVWRMLDQLGLPNPRAYRWKDAASETAQAPS